MIARIAVNVKIPAIDKLYDYAVPETMQGGICRGVRVLVPFGRGNRREEGIVLAVTEESSYKKPKHIDTVLDQEPLLSEELLRLAVHLKERLHCTFYSIIRAMLPAGYTMHREYRYVLGADHQAWEEPADIAALLAFFTDNPKPAKEQKLKTLLPQGQSVADLCRKGILIRIEDFRPSVSEKMDVLYVLTDAGLDTIDEGSSTIRGNMRREILNFLYRAGQAASTEIMYYTGASQAAIRGLLKDGYIAGEEVRVLRQPEADVYMGPALMLNQDQEAAIQGLRGYLDADTYKAALLFGVTGSGKTEVYIALIQRALEQGKGVIVLVPEIALTPQMTARFSHVFGDRIAVLHSGLRVGERYDQWQRIRSGDVRVVVGTRSAVFAPVHDLGLVIMDEEHEHSFASEADPRYHARDVAKYRCHANKALLLLGSATPSVDTAYAARRGEYGYFALHDRAVPVGLPQVIVTDRREAYRAGYRGCLGMELLDVLAHTLENKEQAILFLNRRGSARSIACMACAHVPQCENCSTALSYHRENGRLLCHLCGYSIKMPRQCPVCGSPYLEQIGAGTQQLEEELHSSFPGARVIRMDSDTTSGRLSHRDYLAAFAAGEADILIGTQMIAKGLNFPNVTLAAVVDADMSLYTGDFRSAERSFSLITQVVGRSGRAEKPGFAVIQTLSPQNDVIQAAAQQDYWGFYQSEIAYREALRQPPFCRMIQLMVSAALENDARAAVRRLAARMKVLLGGAFCDISMEILGPAEAPVFKLNNRYRYTLTLRTQDSKRQREFLSGVLLEFSRDPVNQKTVVYADMNL